MAQRRTRPVSVKLPSPRKIPSATSLKRSELVPIVAHEYHLKVVEDVTERDIYRQLHGSKPSITADRRAKPYRKSSFYHARLERP